MWVAGIDYSTHAVDVVHVHLDDFQGPWWFRYEMEGNDAFDRARRAYIPSGQAWDDVLAVGIEDPRGQNAGALYRVQGAILAQIPAAKLVHPLIPSQWRKLVGLPGNATKQQVYLRSWEFIYDEHPGKTGTDWAERAWPQDAHDAHCIALATRTLLERENR